MPEDSNKSAWQVLEKALLSIPGRVASQIALAIPFVLGIGALIKKDTSLQVLIPTLATLALFWAVLIVLVARVTNPSLEQVKKPDLEHVPERSPNQPDPLPAVPAEVKITWSKEVLAGRIPGKTISALRALLEAARAECLAAVRGEAEPAIKDNEVCANLFVFAHRTEADRYSNGCVDDDGIWAGEVGILRMPHSCQIHMNGRQDEDLRFRPYNGATGNAFMTGESYVTTPRGDPRDPSSWGVDQRLTADQWGA